VPGKLWAFDASNITTEIWSSEMVSPNDIANILSKGANPTIANGKVFLGAQDWLDVYGILCNPGTMRCSGGCISSSQLQTDVNNCGSCGRVCGGTANGFPVCTAGSCGLACNAGSTLCGISCVSNTSFKTDVNNCGSCGHVCSLTPHANPTCSAGTCGFSCIYPYHPNCEGTGCISGTQVCP
jgi:hypothetical protein